MTFQKGNQLAKGSKTNGRKRGSTGIGWQTVEDVMKYARPLTREAIDGAAKIMRDERNPASARLAAISIILERAWGKAPQQIEAKIDIYAKLSDDELRAVVLKEVEILALEAAKDAEETQESLLSEEQDESQDIKSQDGKSQDDK